MVEHPASPDHGVNVRYYGMPFHAILLLVEAVSVRGAYQRAPAKVQPDPAWSARQRQPRIDQLVAVLGATRTAVAHPHLGHAQLAKIIEIPSRRHTAQAGGFGDRDGGQP
jgi:hypothetical protein